MNVPLKLWLTQRLLRYCGAEAQSAPAKAEKALFSLERRWLKKDLFAVYKDLMGECKEQGAQLSSEVCGDRNRGNRHKLQDGKFQLDVGKAFFTMDVIRWWRLSRASGASPPWQCSKFGWAWPWAQDLVGCVLHGGVDQRPPGLLKLLCSSKSHWRFKSQEVNSIFSLVGSPTSCWWSGLMVWPSSVWIRVDVGISGADGNHRWSEEWATHNMAPYLLWGRTLGWEEVEESYCDLKQTLTPVRAQVMGFYQTFIKPSSGVFCFLDNFR